MAANERVNKISENQQITTTVEKRVDKITASHHAEKIIQKLREAMLVESRKIKILENKRLRTAENYQAKISENHQAKISENQNIKIFENQNIKISEHRNTEISENQNTKTSDNQKNLFSEVSTLKSILDRKKLHQAKAERLKELLSKEKEHYPDKRRRQMSTKKVVLQPKHEYKVVATTNKRKRTIPVREVDPPTSVPIIIAQEPTPEPELSLSELVRVTDEQGLDEEDFMEILTCPSPVWWESDDEDLSFSLQDIEADIKQDKKTLIQEIDQKARIDDNGNKIREETMDKTGSNTSLTNNAVSKRTKLEKLLNNIKSKYFTTVSKNNVQEFKNDELIKNEFHIKDHIEPKNECNEVNNCDQIEVIHESNSDSVAKDRKISISGLSDVSISDELINTLENIEIPIKESNEVTFQNEIGPEKNDVENYVASIANKEPVRRRKRANNEINVVNNYEFIRKRTRKPNRKYEFDWSPEKKKSKSESPKTETVTKRNNEMLNSKTNAKEEGKLTNDNVKAVKVYKKNVKNNNLLKISKRKPKEVPLDLPPLTKNPFKNKPKVYASPKSIEIRNSCTNEPDSIPDTNITFLDEYNEKTNEAMNVNKYAKGKDGELVTVYQIVTNNAENLDDIEAQIKVNLVNKSLQAETKSNSQIIEFYKTRKRIKKTKKVD